jgi:hypothetical protein
MASLPVEILYGLYLGTLIGVVPVLVAWAFGFLFKYVTGVTVPGLGVVVLAVAIAGASGGLLALTDPTLVTSANQTRLTVALLVVLMGALYAHAMGDRLGATLPRRLTLQRIAERTLSADVVELVGGRGQVRVTVAGEVDDIEGYPPLPADLRATVAGSEYTFPADVPLVELESRVADRLRADHDLAEVSVRLDERARATVAAAPPVGGLSKRVSPGERAVSIRALAPAGLAPGDEVDVSAGRTTVRGTVLGIREPPPSERTDPAGTTVAGSDGGPSSGTRRTATTGGEMRVTLGVDRNETTALLGVDVGRLVARSRGTRREFELIALLRRAGKRFRRVAVGEDGPLDGVTLGEAAVRDAYGVAVLAVRNGDGRPAIAPRGDRRLAAGDRLVVVGDRADLDRFAGAVA